LTEHFVEQMFVFQRPSTFFCLEVTIKLFTVVILLKNKCIFHCQPLPHYSNIFGQN
jgi:hypothetical protein